METRDDWLMKQMHQRRRQTGNEWDRVELRGAQASDPVTDSRRKLDFLWSVQRRVLKVRVEARRIGNG